MLKMSGLDEKFKRKGTHIVAMPKALPKPPHVAVVEPGLQDGAVVVSSDVVVVSSDVVVDTVGVVGSVRLASN